jgi:Na+/H+ antiporter NhaA
MSSRGETPAPAGRLPLVPSRARSEWTEGSETPLRRFLRTETGSAAFLLTATVAALVWINVDPSSYARFWHTVVSVDVGSWSISQDFREWVNTGLMTFFFFVIGLEARREFDMGELRERRRLALPAAAAVGGMAIAVAIFLALNAGTDAAHGWGIAMSTDTAFALGLLALFGRRIPDKLRAFILTVVVVDDLIALGVIATAYTEHLDVVPLLVAIGVFGVFLAAVTAGIQHGMLYVLLGTAAWVPLHESGVEPAVIGLAMGLATFASPAARVDLERATHLFRLFREQPTPELARTARVGLASVISPNERLQQLYHPWTSYLVVPVFALANAGIEIDGSFLASAFTSPITLGIVLGYVIGKPVGILGGSWLAARLSRGSVEPPVGWAAVAGAGFTGALGFTVALLIASLAFTGEPLEEAKLGILTAAICGSIGTWLVFRAVAFLSEARRARAMLGTAESIVDLAVPVDPRRDHVRGPEDALVTIVEYADFECPYCGRAEHVVRALLEGFGDLRYVWRHLPLHDVHPKAQLASEAAEAAAEQGAFWEMHHMLFDHQDALEPDDLVGYALELGLDIERFQKFLTKRHGAARVAEDMDGADLSGVSGTPTFFINGRRHHGVFDLEHLSEAVRTASARAAVIAGRR